LRPDGFAGYEPVISDKPAIIKTTPVVFTGKAVQITTDVKPNGYVKLKLFDQQNNLLGESQAVEKTVPFSTIQWQAGFSVDDKKGDTVIIEFELKDAKIYSFRI